jgi:hypothetical protein
MNPSLLIPTLCSVLLLTALAFFFASKMAPMFLVITSTILLILSYSMHRSQFQSDYRNSTWQEGLRPLAPFVLASVVILLGVGYYFMASADTVTAVPVSNVKPVSVPAANVKPPATGGRRYR